jgi:hypothetical protein
MWFVYAGEPLFYDLTRNGIISSVVLKETVGFVNQFIVWRYSCWNNANFFCGKLKHDLCLACSPFCSINLSLRTFFNVIILPFCHACICFLTSNYFIKETSPIWGNWFYVLLISIINRPFSDAPYRDIPKFLTTMCKDLWIHSWFYVRGLDFMV